MAATPRFVGLNPQYVKLDRAALLPPPGRPAVVAYRAIRHHRELGLPCRSFAAM